MIKIRAEISKTETKRTTQRINAMKIKKTDKFFNQTNQKKEREDSN
jgi:hypothetical protein